MKERKINLEYLNLYQEIPLFCALVVSSFFRTKTKQKTRSVLIVNTCLIGEFAASVPAIRDYIERNDTIDIDLMVSPPLAPLAEKIRGVRRVYTARSLYGRPNEKLDKYEQKFSAYDLIFAMRISRDAYRLISDIPTNHVRTCLKEHIGYAVHLWWSLLKRKPPKQWVKLNFEMLGGKVREIPFDDIFQFSENDYVEVENLDALQTIEKKVIIHAGAGWIMKKWSNDKWTELLDKIRELGNVRFIFVGGREDSEDFAEIESKLDFKIYSLIGKINLLQFLLVLRRSDYFIGTDSGPRNMAHLADTRSVTILGPGPHFYMPWDKKDIVIDKSNGRGLYQMFFLTKNGFIDRITVDEVFATFKNKIWNF